MPRLLNNWLKELLRKLNLCILNAVGKKPERKDALAMPVMAGSRYRRQLEKGDAGMGLSSPDLKDTDFKVFDTSVSETG